MITRVRDTRVLYIMIWNWVTDEKIVNVSIQVFDNGTKYTIDIDDVLMFDMKYDFLFNN